MGVPKERDARRGSYVLMHHFLLYSSETEFLPEREAGLVDSKSC